MLNRGEFDPFVVQSGQTEGESKAVNGKLEIRIGRRIVPLLNEVEVIVDLVDVQFGGQLVEVKGDVCQMEGVVPQGAFAFSRDRDFLL